MERSERSLDYYTSSEETPERPDPREQASSLSTRPTTRAGSLLSRRGGFSSFRSNTFSKFSRSTEADDDSQEDKGRLGLNTLYDPPSAPALVDIVFVHGIGGSSRKTWAYSGDEDKFWPQSWLPADPDFEDARIHSFGYSADWGKRTTTTMNIHDFAQSLIGEIRNNPLIRRSDTRIILVGHSMGGCLAKKAYILARQDPGLEDLASRIRSMFFLGTPHRGSDLAGILRNMLQVTWNSKPYISDLVSNSAALAEINDTFRHYSTNLRLWSFFETLPASNRLDVLVVDKFSATLGYSNEEISAMDADHRHVCKFKSQLDPNYRKVRNALSSAMDSIRATTATSTPVNKETRLKAFFCAPEVPEDDLAMLLDMKSPGSCSWFTETPFFTEWVCNNPEEPPIYWLAGPPATGKSVICGHTIDYLKNRGLYCSYYFFKQGKSGSRNLSSLLLSLTYQMALQDESVAHIILKLDSESTSFDNQDERSIWRKILVPVLKGGYMTRHAWIIDGLDECFRFSNLFRFMSDFPPGLRAFVTSRITPEIDRGITSLGVRVNLRRLSVDDTLPDIRTVIESKMFELALRDADQLTDRILQKSAGSFLWVHLVLQELEMAYTDEDIENILTEVPEGLYNFYRRILKSIESEKRRAKLAKSMLTWVALAARPLTVEELRCAVHLDISETPMEQAIATTCGQLTFIDQSGRVQMIHETAREFLFSNDLDSELAVPRGQSHGYLAELCLAYLSNCLRPQPTSRLLKSRALSNTDVFLLDYAAEAFSQHLYRSKSEESGPFNALCSFLDTSVLSWVEHAAKAKNLALVAQTAMNLSAYMERRTNHVPPIDKTMQHLEAWVLDLSRVATKFRKPLLDCPSSIHNIIPALCPTDSAIAQKAKIQATALSLAGLKDSVWDDCLMRVDYSLGLTTTIGQGEKYFAIGRSTGNIDIYDVESLQHVSHLVHPERVRFLDFGPESEYLASAGAKHLVIWDSKTGAKLHELPSQQPLALCFSGPLLLLATKDREVVIRDLEFGDVEVQNWSDASPDIPKQAPNKVVFSELGLMALAYRNHPIYVVDIERHTLLGSCPAGKNNGVDTMVFNPNPDIYALVASFTVGDLVVFDTRSMERIMTRQHTFAHSMACSDDGRFLLTGSSNGTIEVYEFEGLDGAIPVLIYRITSVRESIRSVSFSSNGLRFVNISSNKCRVWEPSILVRKFADTVSQSDFSGGANLPPRVSNSAVGHYQADVSSMAVIADGLAVLCGKSNGEVAIFSISDGKELSTLFKHASGVSQIATIATDDGHLVVTLDDSGQVMVGQLLDPVGSNEYSPLLSKRQEPIITGLLLSGPSRDRLVVRGRTFAELWALPSGRVINRIEFPEDNRWSILQNPSNSKEILVLENSTARRLRWDSLDPTGSPEVALNRKGPLEEVDSSWIKTNYGSSNEYLIELHHHVRDRHITQVNCWNSDVFSLQGGLSITLDGPNELHFLSGMVRSLIAMTGSTVFFLDKSFWVCSLDVKRFASTLVARRHFFILPEWLDQKGNIVCELTTRQEFVFAHKHSITIVKSGVEFSETVSYVPESQTWKLVPGTMHRRTLGSLSSSSGGGGSSESRPLSIQLRGSRRLSEQGLSIRREISPSNFSLRRGSGPEEESSRKGSLK